MANRSWWLERTSLRTVHLRKRRVRSLGFLLFDAARTMALPLRARPHRDLIKRERGRKLHVLECWSVLSLWLERSSPLSERSSSGPPVTEQSSAPKPSGTCLSPQTRRLRATSRPPSQQRKCELLVGRLPDLGTTQHNDSPCFWPLQQKNVKRKTTTCRNARAVRR